MAITEALQDTLRPEVVVGKAPSVLGQRMTERAFFPIAVFAHTIPILAHAPILVSIFGPGMTARVMSASLICFFQTRVNMVHVLQPVSPQTPELARILSATKSEVFWKIRLPTSLPFLFSALKIAATTCVTGAIVSEWISTDVGLGALNIDSTFYYLMPPSSCPRACRCCRLHRLRSQKKWWCAVSATPAREDIS